MLVTLSVFGFRSPGGEGDEVSLGNPQGRSEPLRRGVRARVEAELEVEPERDFAPGVDHRGHLQTHHQLIEGDGAIPLRGDPLAG